MPVVVIIKTAADRKIKTVVAIPIGERREKTVREMDRTVVASEVTDVADRTAVVRIVAVIAVIAYLRDSKNLRAVLMASNRNRKIPVSVETAKRMRKIIRPVDTARAQRKR